MQAVLPLLMLVALWALMIRPQQQQARRRRELLQALEVGDEVIVAGAYGTIRHLDPESVTVEVAPGTVIRYARAAVNERLTATTTDPEQ